MPITFLGNLGVGSRVGPAGGSQTVVVTTSTAAVSVSGSIFVLLATNGSANTPTVSDSAGNTYSLLASKQNGTGLELWLFQSVVASSVSIGSSITATLTPGAAGPVGCTAHVLGFTGLLSGVLTTSGATDADTGDQSLFNSGPLTASYGEGVLLLGGVGIGGTGSLTGSSPFVTGSTHYSGSGGGLYPEVTGLFGYTSGQAFTSQPFSGSVSASQAWTALGAAIQAAPVNIVTTDTGTGSDSSTVRSFLRSIYDGFDHPDGLLNGRLAETGQPWTATSMSVSGSVLYGTSATVAGATVNARTSGDVILQATVGVNTDTRLLWRYVNSSNYLMILWSATSTRFFKRVAGVLTQIGPTVAVTISNGDVLEVRAYGSQFSLHQNGVRRVSYLDTEDLHPTGQTVGIDFRAVGSALRDYTVWSTVGWVGETASGSETVTLTANITAADTGAGVETVTTNSSRSTTDTGSGSDVGAGTAGHTCSDTCSGTDNANGVTATQTTTDTGAGDDTGVVTASIFAVDSGSGSEVLTQEELLVEQSATDTGTSSEIARINLAATDSGTGVDTATARNDCSGDDIGSGVDTATLGAGISASDTGSGTEVLALSASQTITDTGSGSDAPTADSYLRGLVDAFARTNGTLAGQLADTGQPWIGGSTLFTLDGELVSSLVPSIATIDARTSNDFIARITVGVCADTRFLFRYQDANNYYMLLWTDVNYRFFSRIGGSLTQIGPTVSASLASGDILEVRVSGNQLWADGAYLGADLDPGIFSGSTQVGLDLRNLTSSVAGLEIWSKVGWAGETAVGTDTAVLTSVAVSGTDSGTGTDTGTPTTSRTATDTGSGSDSAALTTSRSAVDTGTGVDTASLVAAVTTTDTAAATDTPTADSYLRAIVDNFGRTNGSLDTQLADTGQIWSSSNLLTLDGILVPTTALGIGTLDARTSSDFIARITLGDTYDTRFLFRYADNNNNVFVLLEPTRYRLYQRVAGVLTQLGSTVSATFASGDIVEVRVTANGFYLDGGSGPFYLDTTGVLSGNTRVGFDLRNLLSSVEGLELWSKVGWLSDTGAGVEATTLTASISAVDTGSGTETVAITSSRSASDTGSGTDAGTVTAQIGSSDTGSGSDTGTTSSTRSVTDSGSGVDTGTVSASSTVSDTGSGSDTATVVASLTASDTGSGSDSVSLSTTRVATDTASGSESGVVVAQIGSADSGTGTDTGSPSSTRSVTDTGSGSDTGTVTAQIGSSDSGTGTDTVPGTSTVVSVSDTGSGLDSASISSTRTASDTGNGADTAAVTAVITATDTGTGTDTTSISSSRSATDTGSGSDAGTVTAQIGGSDTGSGTDTGNTSSTRSVVDTGSGTDTASITSSRSASDTGSGVDTGTVSAQIGSADSGSGSDTGGSSSTRSVTDTGSGTDIASTTTTRSASDLGAGADTVSLDSYLLGMRDAFQRTGDLAGSYLDTGQAWNAQVGYLATLSGALQAGDLNTPKIATANAGVSGDFLAQFTFGRDTANFLFRYVDDNNYYFLQVSSATVSLNLRQAGSDTQLQTISVTPVSGDVFGLDVRNGLIVAERNGLPILQVTDTQALSGTFVGFHLDLFQVSAWAIVRDFYLWSHVGYAHEYSSVFTESCATSGAQTRTDTGTGTDTGAVTATQTQTDTGTGVDTATVTATTTASDTGSGSETVTITAQVPASDTGVGGDTPTADSYLLAIVDSFGRANGPLLGQLADTGQPWLLGSNLLTLDGSLVSTSSIGQGVLDARTDNDFIARVTVGNPTEASFIFRYVDNDNHLILEWTEIGYRFQERTSGALTQVGPWILTPVSSGDILEIRVTGNQLFVEGSIIDYHLDGGVFSGNTQVGFDLRSLTSEVLGFEFWSKVGWIGDTGTGVESVFIPTVDIVVEDTGVGTEAVAITVTTSASDSGSGVDAATVSTTITAADTGTGVDTAAVTATSVATDTGTGTEAGIIAAQIGSTDSGTGADSGTASSSRAVTDTGSGTETVTITAQIGSTDTGTGTDTAGSPTAATVVADTGSGVETARITVYATDTGSGVDTVSITSSRTSSDTGSGVDAGTVTAQIGSSDSGSGSDTGSTSAVVSVVDTGTTSETATTSASVTVSDTGSGTETGQISIPATDTGSGTDTVTLSSTRTATDTGSGTETGLISVGSSDTGSGTDTGTTAATTVVVDTGASTEAVWITVYATDSGTATDTASINSTRSASDTGSGSDVASVSAQIGSNDTGSGSDTGAVSATTSVTDTSSGSDALQADSFLRAVVDDFNRSLGPLQGQLADTGQPWSASGLITVDGQLVASTFPNLGLIDSRASNSFISRIKLGDVGTGRFYFRYQDDLNSLFLEWTTSDYQLYLLSGGVTTALGSPTVSTLSSGDILEFRATGNNLFQIGNTAGWYLDTENLFSTQTTVGFSLLDLLSTVSSWEFLSHVGWISETASGSDTVTQVTVSFTTADTGSGSDTAALTSSRVASETGSGSDSGSVIAAIPATDSGSSSEAGIITAQIGGSDSGTGTDTSSGAAAVVSVSDTGSGVELGSIYLQVADSGQGTEAVVSANTFTCTDTGSGSEVGRIRLTASDTASGVDVSAAEAAHQVSDTGSGVEANTLNVYILVTDYFAYDEDVTLTGPDANLVEDDSVGTDTAYLVTVGIVVGDTGVGEETGTVSSSCQDTGSGSEVVTLDSYLLGVYDSFATSGSLLTRLAETGQPWLVDSGDAVVSGGVLTRTGGSPFVATIQARASDGLIFKITATTSGDIRQLLRADGNDNHLFALWFPTSARLFSRISSVNDQLTPGVSITQEPGDVLEFRINEGYLSLWKNKILLASYLDTEGLLEDLTDAGISLVGEGTGVSDFQVWSHAGWVGEQVVGTDSVTYHTASTTATDSGIGEEAVQIEVVTAAADTGSGSEETAIVATIGSTDTSTGTDTGTITASQTVVDTGSGAETGQVTADNTAADSGSGSEATSLDVLVLTSDTGTGSETVSTVSYRSTEDSGVGVDTTSITASLTATDTGSGTETSVLDASWISTDTGVADEIVRISVPTQDTGTGDETGAVSAAISSSDTGTAVEEGLITVYAADSGSGIETYASAAPFTGTDAGSGSDTGTVQVYVPVSEEGSGQEAVYTSSSRTAVDSGEGVETTDISASLTTADTGNGSEAATVTAQLVAQDTGSGTEVTQVTSSQTVTDTGSGDETLSGSAALTAVDLAEGTESATTSTSCIASDSGSGSEQAFFHLSGDEDTGSGTDVGSVYAVIPVSDSGAGVEAAYLTILSQDNGDGAEAVTLYPVVLAQDSGTGLDSGVITVYASDTGSGTESVQPGNLTVEVSAAETGSGSEALFLTLSAADVGLANELVLIQALLSANDSGTGSEDYQLAAQLGTQEVGTGQDQGQGYFSPTVSDSGFGVDLLALTVMVSEQGNASEAYQLYSSQVIAESGFGYDFFHGLLFLSDSGQGEDSNYLVAQLLPEQPLPVHRPWPEEDAAAWNPDDAAAWKGKGEPPFSCDPQNPFAPRKSDDGGEHPITGQFSSKPPTQPWQPNTTPRHSPKTVRPFAPRKKK